MMILNIILAFLIAAITFVLSVALFARLLFRRVDLKTYMKLHKLKVERLGGSQVK